MKRCTNTNGSIRGVVIVISVVDLMTLNLSRVALASGIIFTKVKLGQTEGHRKFPLENSRKFLCAEFAAGIRGTF